MRRQSFEDHCDNLLLGSDRNEKETNQLIKESHLFTPRDESQSGVSRTDSFVTGSATSSSNDSCNSEHDKNPFDSHQDILSES